MENFLKAATIAAVALGALPDTVYAAGLAPVSPPAITASAEAQVTEVGFRRDRAKKRDRRIRKYPRPQSRPDLYRAFDRERIYTDGIARGPSGHRKIRPEFRDGRAFTLFGRRAR